MAKAGAGYVTVWVPSRGRVYEHRWVWEQQNGPIPTGLEINHKDGIKTNNSLDNLQLVTHQQNQAHAWATGLMRKPPLRAHRKLTDEQIAEIRARYVRKIVTAKMLALEYGVHAETVARIIRGDAWPPNVIR